MGSEPRARARLPLLYLAVSTTIAVVIAAQCLTTGGALARGPAGFAYSIEVAAEIDPGTERELERGLKEAERKDASVVIIRLDTPGGRGSSMRAMVRDIVAAPMPVIVYVHPSGGHAESAGVFLTLAVTWRRWRPPRTSDRPRPS